MTPPPAEPDGRLPRAPRNARELHELGEEPDPRFTFANERTFLAWNRTGLALIAAGLAAAQLLKLDGTGTRLAIALPPIALGALLAATSYHRWLRAETALRLKRPLPHSPLLWALAGGTVVVAVLAAVVAIVAAT